MTMRRYRHKIRKNPIHGIDGEESYEIQDQEIMAILSRPRGETTWTVMGWRDVGQPNAYGQSGGFAHRHEARAVADGWVRSQRAMATAQAKAKAEHDRQMAAFLEDLKKAGIEAKPVELFGGYLPTPGEVQKGEGP